MCDLFYIRCSTDDDFLFHSVGVEYAITQK